MAATPVLAIPYPVGTDRVMDGDNVMQAIAERVEALLEARPRGQIARAEITADAGPYQVEANPVPGLTFVAPLVNGRLYRCTASGVLNMTSGAGRAQIRLYRGTGTTHFQTMLKDMTVNAWDDFYLSRYFPCTGTGNETFRLSAQSTPGSNVYLNAAAWQAAVLVLEDIGPVSGGALLDALRERRDDETADNELPDGPPDLVDNELPETPEHKEGDPS